MKLLLDENIPVSYISELKMLGNDVIHINNNNKGMKDKEVYKLAQKEKRFIITNDDDFNNFLFMNHYGIIKLNGIIRNEIIKINFVLKEYKIDRITKICSTYSIYNNCYYKIIPKYSKKGKKKNPQKLKCEYKQTRN